MKRERRYYEWLPVIAWMLVIFILSAQPADQSIVLSGSVTRFLADVLNQLAAFIEYFTRAQGTVVFLAGVMLLIYLLETKQDEPKLFGIKKTGSSAQPPFFWCWRSACSCSSISCGTPVFPTQAG